MRDQLPNLNGKAKPIFISKKLLSEVFPLHEEPGLAIRSEYSSLWITIRKYINIWFTVFRFGGDQ